MGLAFKRNTQAECALCGSTESLTGEHKIKASLIKQEFQNRPASFFGKDTTRRPKLAQGPKSKIYHFNSKICVHCNASATQRADTAFDRLHLSMKQLYESGCELTDENHRPNHSEPADSELDTFRYFAKILCCFMAESGGPRPTPVALFAIGKLHDNPVFLRITKDEEYEKTLIAYGSDGFAQHGGLRLTFDNKKRRVNSIVSSLAIGGISYEFWVQLSWFASTELRLCYPEFVETALKNIEKT